MDQIAAREAGRDDPHDLGGEIADAHGALELIKAAMPPDADVALARARVLKDIGGEVWLLGARARPESVAALRNWRSSLIRDRDELAKLA